MIILIALLGYLILGGVVMFLLWRLSRAKGDLFAATREVSRARARLDAARKQVFALEERVKLLTGHVESSLTNTSQALHFAGQIETVGQRVDDLIEYVTLPELEPAGRHVCHHALPGGVPDGSIANGAAHYVRDYEE